MSREVGAFQLIHPRGVTRVIQVVIDDRVKLSSVGELRVGGSCVVGASAVDWYHGELWALRRVLGCEGDVWSFEERVWAFDR